MQMLAGKLMSDVITLVLEGDNLFESSLLDTQGYYEVRNFLQVT